MPSPSPRAPREREIFLAALDCQTEAERQAFLQRACAGHPALLSSVEALLALHQDDGFLETPPLPPRDELLAAPPPPAGHSPESEPRTRHTPGTRIGPYKLLELIGEGGAGTVYMAEQDHPVRRRVALKLIKPGMDTRSVIGRFEMERQALALMDHPNIARVLDAGTTPAGAPFFVMELVRGTRITSYCDEHRLPIPQRLRLFIQICRAIEHAHQKGIIHRDIKPSNILVTHHDGIPVPKVIDFGIAKAIGQPLTDLTVFTGFQTFIGTPAYMSPEQAEMSGLDIDTRSDVYSLGVLLYEILTGRPPFDPGELTSSGLDGLRHTLREREPLAPSIQIRTLLDADRTTTASHHQLAPARLEHLLKGDLDWIVLKALEKDRNRRYATASALAQDVQAHLDEEPITARPPSNWYRLGKLARRHRLACASAAAFGAALLLGLGLASWQYLEKSAALELVERARTQEQRLRQEAQAAGATEALLRQKAQTQELRARRRAYAADLNLSQHALASHNLGRARELLVRQIPGPAEPDLRGWEWRYLWHQCGSDALFSLPTQPHEVTALALASDRQRLVAATSAGRLALIDLRSRQTTHLIESGTRDARPTFAATGPGFAFVATLPPSADSRVPRQALRVANAQTGAITQEYLLEGTCLALAAAPEGGRWATVTTRAGFQLWEPPATTPRVTLPIPALPRFPGAIEFSRDLRQIALPLGEGRVRVFHLESQQTLATLRVAEESPRAMQFSPDASLLATGGGFSESSIGVWDIASGSRVARLEGHRGWISALQFWPDGRTLASASADQTVRIWSLPLPTTSPTGAGAEPRTVPASEGADPNSGSSPIPTSPPGQEERGDGEIAVLRGHQLEVWSLAVAPDIGLLLSGSKDGSIFAWDTQAGRRDRGLRVLPQPVVAWAFLEATHGLRTLDAEGRVARWSEPDFQDPVIEGSIGAKPPQLPFGNWATFSSDGRVLLLLKPGESLPGAWRLGSGPPIPLALTMPEASAPGRRTLLGFLPGTHRGLTQEESTGRIESWDLDQPGSPPVTLASPALPPGPYPGPAFSRDAQWWLVPSDRLSRRLLNPSLGLDLTLDLGAVQGFASAFSPDGSQFALVGAAGVGEVWTTRPARRVGRLGGFLQGLSDVAFSRDGSRILVASDHREAVKIWDAEDLHELVTLSGSGARFTGLTFSPEGRLLGARNGRGFLHVWIAATAEETARLDPSQP